METLYVLGNFLAHFTWSLRKRIIATNPTVVPGPLLDHPTFGCLNEQIFVSAVDLKEMLSFILTYHAHRIDHLGLNSRRFAPRIGEGDTRHSEKMHVACAGVAQAPEKFLNLFPLAAHCACGSKINDAGIKENLVQRFIIVIVQSMAIADQRVTDGKPVGNFFYRIGHHFLLDVVKVLKDTEPPEAISAAYAPLPPAGNCQGMIIASARGVKSIICKIIYMILIVCAPHFGL
jgi:hypothetical protein